MVKEIEAGAQMNATFGTAKRDVDSFRGLATNCGWRSRTPHPTRLGELRLDYECMDTLKSFVGLSYASSLCRRLAAASRVLGRDLQEAHRWLVLAASLGLDHQEREAGEYSRIALYDAFCIGVARDWETLTRYSAAHLASPEGIPGQEGPGGKTPSATQEHFWYFMNFVATYHARGRDEAREALALALAQKPPTQWAWSSRWWEAMCHLAQASFDGDAERVRQALAETAEPTAKLFHDLTDIDPALCGMSLALATIAVRQGVDLRPAPHPSCPVELFYFPPEKVRVLPWNEVPDVDDDLRDAILRGADGDVPSARAKKAGRTARVRRPAK